MLVTVNCVLMAYCCYISHCQLSVLAVHFSFFAYFHMSTHTKTSVVIVGCLSLWFTVVLVIVSCLSLWCIVMLVIVSCLSLWCIVVMLVIVGFLSLWFIVVIVGCLSLWCTVVLIIVSRLSLWFIVVMLVIVSCLPFLVHCYVSCLPLQ